MSFAGKVALVTGGGSGIGAACAALLAERGARVVIVDVDRPRARDVAAKLGVMAAPQEGDVSDPQHCEEMVEATLSNFGRLDVAINSAGIAPPKFDRLADVALEDWRSVLSVNLDGIFYSMRAELPAILKSGGGAIVNVASAVSTVALADRSAYVASKHGVLGLTRAAALDYAREGVRVNAVGPGVTETPLTAPRAGDLVGLHPLGRLGQPREVAELAVFLASDAASFCTGGWYAADGGWTAR